MRIRHKSLSLAFAFKGSIVKRLFKNIIFITILTTGLLFIHELFPVVQIGAQLPGYMAATLGLLLVFRNNTAYEKWWEARKEIGALVNTCRNIGITINCFPPDIAEKISIAELTKAFAYSLKEHLRDGVNMDDLKDLHITKVDYNKIDAANHKPNMIVNIMMLKAENLYQQKIISEIQQRTLVNHFNGLIDILGKCERIRNTPIPIAYGFLLKFFITLYIVVLPLGMTDIGYWAVPLVLVLYYILMSIVITAEEIEEPFGRDLNDLPFDTIAVTISNNINELVEHH